MIFNETKLKGAYIVSINKFEDERGYFARAFCKKEMENLGLESNITQCNLSFNEKKGTLRGMHFQKEPYSEVKYIRCIKGSLYDVIIDLREQSATYMQWVGVELTEQNGKALYIPKGFAHGYVTLEDNTTAYYQVSEFYNKNSEDGVRWNDLAFNIKWPIEEDLIISDKDKVWALYKKNNKENDI